MISPNFPAGFSNFQSALSAVIGSLSPSSARSTLQDIRDLSQWGARGDRPRTLADLLELRRSLALWLDPRLAAPVCAVLQLDAREVYAREVRAERLLEGHRSLALTLTERIHASPATQIVRAMRAYPEATLTLLRESDASPAPMSPSVLDWLVLELQQGESLILRAQGAGSRELLEAIEAANCRGWRVDGPAPRARRVHSKDPRDVAGELAAISRELGIETLSGIYHVATRQLHVGPSTVGHPVIAAEAGFPEQDSFCRVSFERSGDGVKAYFPEIYSAFQLENIGGRRDVKKWLEPLFDSA